VTTADHVPVDPSSEIPESPSELEQAISARAYELYLQRGGEGGTAEEDWLRAESELVAERPKQQAA